jgi:hypothetical protein
MYCSKCGGLLVPGAAFCPSCGQQSAVNPTVQQQYLANPKSRSKNGIGITSIVFGSLALVFGLSDYGNIQTGSFDYVYSSEIGILFLAGVAGLILGIISSRATNKPGRVGLVISAVSLLVTFVLASYGA